MLFNAVSTSCYYPQGWLLQFTFRIVNLYQTVYIVCVINCSGCPKSTGSHWRLKNHIWWKNENFNKGIYSWHIYSFFYRCRGCTRVRHHKIFDETLYPYWLIVKALIIRFRLTTVLSNSTQNKLFPFVKFCNLIDFFIISIWVCSSIRWFSFLLTLTLKRYQ